MTPTDDHAPRASSDVPALPGIRKNHQPPAFLRVTYFVLMHFSEFVCSLRSYKQVLAMADTDCRYVHFYSVSEVVSPDGLEKLAATDVHRSESGSDHKTGMKGRNQIQRVTKISEK